MLGLVRRADVVEVNLDPAVGSEARKTRPCAVIPVTIVAAFPGAENVPKRYPIAVLIHRGQGGLVKDSIVQCSQLRSVDERRILKRSVIYLRKPCSSSIKRFESVSRSKDLTFTKLPELS